VGHTKISKPLRKRDSRSPPRLTILRMKASAASSLRGACHQLGKAGKVSATQRCEPVVNLRLKRVGRGGGGAERKTVASTARDSAAHLINRGHQRLFALLRSH
jgi:hypothetical protein